MPFFRGRKGVAGKALDGWSFESVNLWQSAVPATVLAGTVQNPSGGPLAVPDVNLDSLYAGCARQHFGIQPAVCGQ